MLGTPLKPPVPRGTETAVFGLGCFWGAERLFWTLDGVYSTSVGYAGGFTPNPTYEEVCTGGTGHAEVVQVVFDPAKISYGELLQGVLRGARPDPGHAPGQRRRDPIPLGDLLHDRRPEAHRRGGAADLRRGPTGARVRPVTTEIATAGPFYYAEDYHQQYLHKVPNGYCGLKGTGVSCAIPN